MKDTFDIPSIHPSVNSRASRARCVNPRWTPKGHCRCFYTPIHPIRKHENIWCFWLVLLLTPCTCPAYDIVCFQFCTAKKVFEIFEKTDDFSKHHAIIEIENDKFGTKYLKTHLHRVISKIVFPHPQLDIKFLNA